MKKKMLNLNEYMKIKEAAEFLGVCVHTLRNWDRKNIFKPRRNPVNKYRYYKKEDLIRFLKQLENTSVEGNK